MTTIFVSRCSPPVGLPPQLQWCLRITKSILRIPEMHLLPAMSAFLPFTIKHLTEVQPVIQQYKIAKASSHSLLGVILDSYFSWKQHINIEGKENRFVSVLRSISGNYVWGRQLSQCLCLTIPLHHRSTHTHCRLHGAPLLVKESSIMYTCKKFRSLSWCDSGNTYFIVIAESTDTATPELCAEETVWHFLRSSWFLQC